MNRSRTGDGCGGRWLCPHTKRCPAGPSSSRRRDFRGSPASAVRPAVVAWGLEDYPQDYQDRDHGAGKDKDAPKFRSDVKIRRRPFTPKSALALTSEFSAGSPCRRGGTRWLRGNCGFSNRYLFRRSVVISFFYAGRRRSGIVDRGGRHPSSGGYTAGSLHVLLTLQLSLPGCGTPSLASHWRVLLRRVIIILIQTGMAILSVSSQPINYSS